MKIKYACDKPVNYMEIENYLNAFEYNLGKKIVVNNFNYENNTELNLYLTSVGYEENYKFIVSKSVECNVYDKVRIIDTNNQFIEYHGKIGNKYFRRFKEYKGFVNNNIYFIKGLTINSDMNNFYSYILDDGKKESHISVLNYDNLLDILKDINDIDLINIYNFLQEKEQKITDNILITTIDLDTNTKMGIKTNNGNIIKFEKQYKNNNGAWVNLTYNDDNIKVSVYGELDDLSTKSKKEDLINDFKKIKYLKKQK